MRRPAYPWLLPLSALALALGILIGREAASLLPGLIALCCAVPAAFMLQNRSRLIAMLACVVSLGCVLGHAAFHPTLPPEGNYRIEGVITDDIHLREDGQVRTVLRSVRLNGESVPAGAYWTYYLAEGEAPPAGLIPGMQISFLAEVYHPQEAVNPGDFNFREYLLQQDVRIGVYGCEELTLRPAGFHLQGMAAALRHRITRQLQSVMGQEAGSYAAALVAGARTNLPDEDKDAFNRLGISHILSVSGFHVGVLAALLRLLLRPFHFSRRRKWFLTGGVLGAYCLLTGLHPPVVRAVLLYLLWGVGALVHRPRVGLHLLAAAWCLLLIASPAQLVSGSFLLSFGAMLGLTVVFPWLKSRRTFRRRWLQRAYEAVCASTAAQLGVLLPQLFIFHEVPLLGLLINPLVIGLSGTIISLCWLVTFLLPLPPLAWLAGQAAALVLSPLLEGVRVLGSMQHTVLWTGQANWLTLLGWALLVFSLSYWLFKRRVLACAAGVLVMALSLIPLPPTNPQYIQFSAGNADAALLRDGHRTVVIDTGEDGLALAAYLHEKRLTVDDLILTHLHSDHAGGLAALMEEGIPVKRLYLPDGATAAAIDPGMPLLVEQLQTQGTEVITLARGDEIPLPHGSITVLWPEKGKTRPGKDANESCLVLLIDMMGTSLLHTSDLSGTYEGYAACPADLLKVAHHGSEDSTSAAFLAVVQPKALLLSSGDAERGELIRARIPLPVYHTAEHGALVVAFTPGGFTVTPYQ